MKEIKINFVDFWPGFNKTNNYFYNLLIQKYKVIIDEDPELLFYSCYNSDYLKYKCTRVFYAPENIRPDFSACDFAFSFDYNKRKNHFRLPLYSLFIDDYEMLNHLQTIKTRDEATRVWSTKSKFCCMVVSNGDSAKRLNFFKKLSKIKKVDSGGGVLNNVGGKVADKLEFIKDYKFVISFENSSFDGYTTEKIVQPFFKDCIPIYWGNKLVNKDFNKKRFIDYNDFSSEEELISKLLEIDQNDELGIGMLMQPTFSPGKIKHHEQQYRVLEILCNIIDSDEKPIADQLWSYIHWSKFIYRKTRKRVLAKLKKYINT